MTTPKQPVRQICTRILQLILIIGTLAGPVAAMAASVTLQWDPNNPTPDGYRVFARTGNAAYDYANPDWEGSAVTCTLANLADGTDYYFVVRAYDGSLESADSEEVHYAGASQNDNAAPSAAGDAYTVAENGTLTVAAAAGVLANDSDPDGDVLTASVYSNPSNGSLKLNSNGSFTYTHNGSETTSDQFGYRVSDGNGSTATATATITVEAVNDSPTADAGSNQSVVEGAAVVLDGSGSSDPDNSSLSYLWAQASGPSVSLSSANAVRPSFTAPAVSADGVSLIFSLTVTDSAGSSSSDTCRVLVNDTHEGSSSASGDGSDTNTDTDNDGSVVAVGDDDDNDAMPDAWERYFGLDPLSDDADGDLDGDGVSNLDEYRVDFEPDMAGTGTPPDPAVTASPANNAINVARDTTLSGRAFADDDGDAHIATQWQIFDSNGKCLMDVITDRRLTSLTVPMLLLDGSSDYRWRLRYFDSGGYASAWSGLQHFTTAAVDNDGDGNGIPDDEESGQLGNHSHAVTVDSGDIALTDIDAASSETAVTISQTTIIDPLDIEIDDSTPDHLPFEMAAYKLYLGNVGAEVQVTLKLSAAAPSSARWLKYDAINGWQEITDRVSFSSDRRSAVITIRDGGTGDADGVANGIILDPTGVSAAVASSSSSSGSAGGGGGGGGGGCFITATGARPDGQQLLHVAAWRWIQTTVKALRAILN